MSTRARAVAAGLGIAAVIVVAAFFFGSSGDDGDNDTPTTTASTTSTTAATSTTSTTATTTTSTTAVETTTTTAPEGPNADQQADGISTAEDAAVFVVTAWIAGDRQAAARHADTVALDSLFAAPAPAIDTVELIECDTADLVTFDCFFAVDGTILIIEVTNLRVVSATIDAD